MILNRDQILAAPGPKVEQVDVPEWGGTVCVRMMTGTQLDAFERAEYEKAKLGRIGENSRAHLLAQTICDEEGNPLFTVADIEALGAKGAMPIERIAKVAQRLNRMDAQAAEEGAKN